MDKDKYLLEQAWSSNSEKGMCIFGDMFKTKRNLSFLVTKYKSTNNTGNKMNLSNCIIGEINTTP